MSKWEVESFISQSLIGELEEPENEDGRNRIFGELDIWELTRLINTFLLEREDD